MADKKCQKTYIGSVVLVKEKVLVGLIKVLTIRAFAFPDKRLLAK